MASISSTDENVLLRERLCYHVRSEYLDIPVLPEAAFVCERYVPPPTYRVSRTLAQARTRHRYNRSAGC